MIAVGGLAQNPGLHVQTFVRVIEETSYLPCCLRWEPESAENHQVAPQAEVLIKFVWNVPTLECSVMQVNTFFFILN